MANSVTTPNSFLKPLRFLRAPLCRITWPVFGALAGFILFLIFPPVMVFFIDHITDKAHEFAITAFATLIAAWAGGAAAFRAERNTRTIDRRNHQVSAANRAIFAINQMYTVYENLREHAINPFRTDANRDLNMDSPQPGMLPQIKFNFDELSFFLDQPDDVSPNALNDLMLLEWKYQVLFQTVEHRARAAERFAHGDALARIVLRGTTDQMIESVDEGVISTQTAYRQLHNACANVFPGQIVLRIQALEGMTPRT